MPHDLWIFKSLRVNDIQMISLKLRLRKMCDSRYCYLEENEYIDDNTATQNYSILPSEKRRVKQAVNVLIG